MCGPEDGQLLQTVFCQGTLKLSLLINYYFYLYFIYSGGNSYALGQTYDNDDDGECWRPVMDEEDPTITAGSIVTVSVRLRRQNMEVLFNTEGRVEDLPAPGGSGDGGEAAGEAEEEEELEEQVPTHSGAQGNIWVKASIIKLVFLMIHECTQNLLYDVQFLVRQPFISNFALCY